MEHLASIAMANMLNCKTGRFLKHSCTFAYIQMLCRQHVSFVILQLRLAFAKHGATILQATLPVMEAHVCPFTRFRNILCSLKSG